MESMITQILMLNLTAINKLRMLNASYDKGAIEYGGSVVHQITDQEKQAYQLTDARVRTYLLKGAQLMANNKVSYKDPTLLGDKFNQMQSISQQPYYRQCRNVLTTKGIQVKDRRQTSISIDTNIFTNTYSQIVTFNTSMTREQKETTTSSWSQTHAFNASYGVTAKVSAIFVEGSTTISFGYTFQYNKTQSKSNEVTLGTVNGAQIPVLPGDTVKAQLIAKSGKGRVEVIYEASPAYGVCLSEHQNDKKDTRINFGLVTQVLKSNNLPTTARIPQVMDVNNFGTSQIIVTQLKK